MLEGMKGVLHCCVDAKCKGRGKKGCTLLMSPRVWEDIEAWVEAV